MGARSTIGGMGTPTTVLKRVKIVNETAKLFQVQSNYGVRERNKLQEHQSHLLPAVNSYENSSIRFRVLSRASGKLAAGTLLILRAFLLTFGLRRLVRRMR
jgi:hypothetical protein